MKYHLRDTLAMLDDDRLRGRVAHDHPPLIGEVRIDRSRRVWNAQSLLEGSAAPRPHLRLVPRRQRRLEPKRNQCHCSSREGNSVRTVPRLGALLPLTESVGAVDYAPVETSEQIVASGAF